MMSPTGPVSSVPQQGVSAPFVLLHGAWHDGSAWADVKAALETCGYPVHTPTLAGHGPAAPNRHVSRSECAAALIDYIEQHDLHHVILVAHSFAGVIAPFVVEALPERMAHLIFLDAIVPVEGQNAFYGTPEDASVPLELHADGTASLPLPVWQERFWHDAGADPALASPERGEAVLASRLSPASFTAAMEPAASLSRFVHLREAGLPTTYIRLLGDQVFGDPACWQIMVDRLPGCRVMEMAGSHEVLFTRPEALANTLLEAAGAQPPFLLEAQTAVMRRFYAALNRGDLAGMLRLVAPDFIEHRGEQERGYPEIGHEPFRQRRLRTREQLADLQVTLCEARSVRSDALLLHAQIRGTNRADGQPLLRHAVSLVRFNRLGQLAEHWEYQFQAAPELTVVPA